jgi:hypothetical protein
MDRASIAHFISAFRPVITASVVYGVLWMGNRLRRRRAYAEGGWRYLTPGPLMWFALIGGVVFLGFLGLASRSSASWDHSNIVAFWWLVVGFGSMTLAIAASTLIEQVRWNDHGIERRTLFFQRRSLTWHQLSAVGYEMGTGYWWVSAFEGPRIRFSPYYNGFIELLRTIRGKLPTDHAPTAAVTSMDAILARVTVPVGRTEP